MNSTVVVVTDLGCFRAYRLENGIPGETPRLELIDESKSETANAKLSEIVTDGQGRFPRGGGPKNIPGDMSSGERNDLELEEKRRQIKATGSKLEDLLSTPEVDDCYFAAGSEIHEQILSQLTPKSRAKISKTVAGNIVKLEKKELLARF